jgi:hypothetical protein
VLRNRPDFEINTRMRSGCQAKMACGSVSDETKIEKLLIFIGLYLARQAAPTHDGPFNMHHSIDSLSNHVLR